MYPPLGGVDFLEAKLGQGGDTFPLGKYTYPPGGDTFELEAGWGGGNKLNLGGILRKSQRSHFCIAYTSLTPIDIIIE